MKHAAFKQYQTSVIELVYVDSRANHDKFYRVYLDHQTSEVYSQYGRNGTEGTWTNRKAAANIDAGQKEMQKLVTKKMAKGYRPHKAAPLTSVTPFTTWSLSTAVCNLPVTGEKSPASIERGQAPVVVAAAKAATADPKITARIASIQRHPLTQAKNGATRTTSNPIPMLAEIAEKGDVRPMLKSDQWSVQLKLDGERALIEVDNGTISVLNRQGVAKVRNIGADMLAPFVHLTEGYWLFDGEIVGRDLWLFDMPVGENFHDERTPFEQRFHHLVSIVRSFGDCEHLKLVETATTVDDKQAMLAAAEADHREGVIFRRNASSYQHARRSGDLRKHKFIKEVDCFVTEVGRGGKENAVLAVFNDGVEQEIGQVSTIGKGTVNVGDVLEVAYLYVVDGDNPRLYQPRILRKRRDKAAAECSIAQFADAVTNKELS